MLIKAPPKWFNEHGYKMSKGKGEPICRVATKFEVVAGSKVAQVQIRPIASHGLFQVLWRITFAPDEFVQGQLQMSEDDLRGAFAVEGKPNPRADIIFGDEYNSEVVPGHYIRSGRFLKMPSMGTSDDGDSNISIYLDDEIIDAVRRLIAACD